MKLAEWARANGVHPQAAYRWLREDRVPVAARRLESGTVWVGAAPADESGRVAACARVSSRDRRRDLDRRVARLTGWATTANGHAAGEAVTGAGSGLSGKRPKLRRILPDPSAGVVVAGTGTGWPGAGRGTCKPRCRRTGGRSWSRTPVRALVSWCAT